MKQSWASRLESKLTTLVSTSSKESLQTLARWIAFNRKRSSRDFVPLFVQSLREQPERQEVILGVIHEILVLDRPNAIKWDRLEEFRIALGETILLACADQLTDAAKNKALQDYCKEWDDANSFGGPTLLNQLRKKLQVVPKEVPVASSPAPASETKTTPTIAAAPSPPKATATAAKTSLETPKTKNLSLIEEDSQISPVDKTTVDTKAKDVAITSSNLKESVAIAYDFESHGIPPAPVDSSQLQEPCRAIATLQIARDLRNDGAVQLSSALSAMPKDIRTACAKAAEDETYTLDDVTARDFSLRISETLLDMDLDEQLQNVKIFRNIVDRQRQAREDLIRLLIQSRCKFGADEAAEAFYQADRSKDELLRRKQILMDAMELEGLDVVFEEDDETKKTENAAEDELPPLSWYKRDLPSEEDESQATAKRARIEQ